jgi:hypothetical protein
MLINLGTMGPDGLETCGFLVAVRVGVCPVIATFVIAFTWYEKQEVLRIHGVRYNSWLRRSKEALLRGGLGCFNLPLP